MFAPGDEVVCVSGPLYPTTCSCVQPQVGAHYIVRSVRNEEWPQGETIDLREISNAPREHFCADGTYQICEHEFFASRFRPVRRESIEIFRAMCVSKKPLVPVDG